MFKKTLSAFLFLTLILGGLFFDFSLSLADETNSSTEDEGTTEDEAAIQTEATEEVTPAYAATVQIISYKETWTDLIYQYGMGSGTIIREDGVILTNNHLVVDQYDEPLAIFEICLTISAEEESSCGYTASLIERNEDLDLALLKMYSQDLNGNEIGSQTYLDYKTEAAPLIGDTITVYGYPVYGGGTITYSEGSVSGFEEISGVQYIKTDAYLSFGSSGGTALDSESNFLGIPTYEYYDLGYLLDIREAEDWIEENIDRSPEVNDAARTLLEEEMQTLNEAVSTGTYLRSDYPSFQISLPDENWEFYGISREGVSLYNSTEGLALQTDITLLPFEVNDAYLEHELEEAEEAFGEWANDYEVAETTFKGVEASLVTFKFWDYQMVVYVVPYGYALLEVFYNLNLDESEEQTEKINSVLDTFEFLEESSSTPEVVETLTFLDPSFSISRNEDWYIQKNQNVSDQDLLATFLREDDPEAQFEISFPRVGEDEKDLSNEEMLEEEIEDTEDTVSEFTLVSSDSEVVMDGLSGWSLTYTFEGGRWDEELGFLYSLFGWDEGAKLEKKKSFDLYLPYSEDYLFHFNYTDSEENYGERLEGIKEILATFKHQSPEYESTGEFQIGSLDAVFSDLNYHRYEKEVMDLYNRGLVSGYLDGAFQPEKEITRAEVLKIVLTAKLNDKYEEDEDQVAEALDSLMQTKYGNLDFDDSKYNWYTKYIRYAHYYNYVFGYKEGGARLFRPNSGISLAETLSLIYKVYKVPYWKRGETLIGIDWRKPLMDRGYDLDLIPKGLSDPDTKLTRAEFSAIFSDFLEVRG